MKIRICRAGLSAILIGISLSACNSADDGARSERPNVLVIVTDDMGYTDLGAFGGEDIATPNLDRLALDGLRLTNFHTAPSCAPARAMLMSGTGNHEAGLGTQIAYPEFEGRRNYERFLQPQVAVIPEVLSAAGYRTYMAGKWHLGSADSTDATLPANRGFEQTFALLQGGDGHMHTVFDVPAAYSENGKRLDELPPDYYSTTLFADKLIGQFDSGREDTRPFFAWFAPTAPHWPLQAPPGWLDRYSGRYDAGFDALCRSRMQGAMDAGVLPDVADISRCPKEGQAWEEIDDDTRQTYLRVMEIYAAMTEHMDHEVGRLLEYLQDSGALDNTWVIFLNDNGPQGGGFEVRTLGNLARSDIDNSPENLGRAWSWTNIGAGWADAISAPYRDGKASQYEGGIRVPAFAWHRNIARAGETEAQLLTAMDLMPTILELTEVPAPGAEFGGRKVLPMRGRSFASLLSGSDDPVHPADEATALDAAGLSVVLRGHWKMVRPRVGDWELYDLAADPGETQNTIESYPDIAAELAAAFEQQSEISNFIRRRQ